MSDETPAVEIPETVKQPQDRKPKATDQVAEENGDYSFTIDGVTYTLPAPDESAALDLPFEVTEALVLKPNDTLAQMRYFLAILNNIDGIDEARAALRGLATKDALEILGGWLGE